MRRLCVLAALTLAAASTAACGGDGDSDSPDGLSGDTADSPSATDERPPITDAPSTGDNGDNGEIGTAAVTLDEIASGLDSPVALAVRPGDDRFYVAEQSGRVRSISDGEVEDEPVLDLSDEVSTANEQGLLGICFSPDGERLYVDYTDTDGDTHVQEFAMSGDSPTADTDSRRELLFVDQPAENHNGGHVTFGPDGMFYIGLGDGGGAGDPDGNGQSLDALLGKILRIDPNPSGDAPYSVPADNPFVDDPSARPEVWQWGLRNPWRFSFDRANNDLWIGDVGQNEYEEIDYAPAGDVGVNWGWNAREGLHTFEGGEPPADARDPIYEYSHSDGGVSVTGGFVYRGAAIPDLVGAYVWADYLQGNLIALVQEGGGLAAEHDLGLHVDEVTSFGEDADGEIYVVSRGGSVYRLDPA